MLDRLTQAERFSGGGALVALVASLMPWYHFDDGASRVTANAFGTGFLGDVVFLCAAGMAFVLLVRHGVIELTTRFADRRVDLWLGVCAFGATALQLLVGVNGSGAFHSATIGLVLALGGTAAMAAGGSLSRGESRTRPARRR